MGRYSVTLPSAGPSGTLHQGVLSRTPVGQTTGLGSTSRPSGTPPAVGGTSNHTPPKPREPPLPIPLNPKNSPTFSPRAQEKGKKVAKASSYKCKRTPMESNAIPEV